ncbi:hypothetical protein GCM10025865_16860 [Paraoerskovia sediminicola]|uniref:Uncharacterized protein n=1 Tax=Paraoerskovia sediminicola TaxID=1138587 RepID=A0ABM8G2X9_9CELL|nr:hypothetical protein GCM10025865_16860 [Paraoerskovia sediminicola]
MGAQRALEGQDEERQRDEGLRHDDGHGREGDLDADDLELLTDQSAAPERVEQCEAPDDGRKDEGEQDEGSDQPLARERRAGEHQGHRHTEQHAERGRRGGGRQRQLQRGPG